MISVGWAIGLLKAVPKVVAAAPEFMKLWDQLVASFDKDTDQQALKDAYEIAMADAADAHQDLDDLVRANS